MFRAWWGEILDFSCSASETLWWETKIKTLWVHCSYPFPNKQKTNENGGVWEIKQMELRTRAPLSTVTESHTFSRIRGWTGMWLLSPSSFLTDVLRSLWVRKCWFKHNSSVVLNIICIERQEFTSYPLYPHHSLRNLYYCYHCYLIKEDNKVWEGLATDLRWCFKFQIHVSRRKGHILQSPSWTLSR